MNTKIIAHRGYSDKFPENTMLAFKKAEEFGADGIELDVHLTKDQQIVICHDETIDRTSTGEGYIKDMTLEDIQEFQFNKGMFIDEVVEPMDITAPSLDTFMEWFAETRLELNIEIKNNVFSYESIVDKVVDLIEKYQVQDRVIISSFNHHTITKIKEIRPTISCGFLTACGLLQPGSYCQKYDVECYHPLFLSLERVDFEDLKQHQVQVNVWTVNETEHIQMMLDAKVDRIITNCVEIAVDIRGK